MKELVFTGEPLDAQSGTVLRAGESRCRRGGVTRRRTAKLAQRIAQRAPVAVQIAKQVIDAGEGCCGLTLEALAGAFFRHD